MVSHREAKKPEARVYFLLHLDERLLRLRLCEVYTAGLRKMSNELPKLLYSEAPRLPGSLGGTLDRHQLHRVALCGHVTAPHPVIPKDTKQPRTCPRLLGASAREFNHNSTGRACTSVIGVGCPTEAPHVRATPRRSRGAGCIVEASFLLDSGLRGRPPSALGVHRVAPSITAPVELAPRSMRLSW